MKGTAKYETLILNVGKWQETHRIARAYAQPRRRTMLLSSLVVHGTGTFSIARRIFKHLSMGPVWACRCICTTKRCSMPSGL